MGLTRQEFEEWKNHLAGIANALPGTWELKLPNDDGPTLNWRRGTLTNHDEHMELFFRIDEHKKQLHISTHLPNDDKGEQLFHVYDSSGNKLTPPTINVGLAKTPSQVARDIERRLMPDYRHILGIALQRIAQSTSYHNTVESVAQQIAQIVGVQIRRDPHNAREVHNKVDFYRSQHPIFRETHGSAEVGSDGVTLELRLSHDDAIALLKYLTGQ